MSVVLIDAGPIIAYYNTRDSWHKYVKQFLESCRGQFITTCPVISEAMYMLSIDRRVQHEMLGDLSKGLYRIAELEPIDFVRIAELNIKYQNLPGDFADLSLIVVSERLDISDIASLDSDFDIYRRYSKNKFNQILSK